MPFLLQESPVNESDVAGKHRIQFSFRVLTVSVVKRVVMMMMTMTVMMVLMVIIVGIKMMVIMVMMGW